MADEYPRMTGEGQAYDHGYADGYRAGLEDAAKLAEDSRFYGDEGEKIAAHIRALAPDNTLRSPSSTERAG